MKRMDGLRQASSKAQAKRLSRQEENKLIPTHARQLRAIWSRVKGQGESAGDTCMVKIPSATTDRDNTIHNRHPRTTTPYTEKDSYLILYRTVPYHVCASALPYDASERQMRSIERPGRTRHYTTPHHRQDQATTCNMVFFYVVLNWSVWRPELGTKRAYEK